MVALHLAPSPLSYNAVSNTSMAAPIPLPTLLSQLLVAFTIEFDNESEHRLQNWTTRGAHADSRKGVWLASQAMWANFMQFIPEEGVPLREVEGLASLTNLKGLIRWGYVTLEPDATDERADPRRPDWVVRPTRSGARARQIWEPLAGDIEKRWRARFGDAEIDQLRESLQSLAGRSEIELPQYLPVVAHAMRAEPERLRAGAAAPFGGGGHADLSALLSKVLLMFTLDFEGQSRLSLPVSANPLRVLGETGIRLRDLPSLTGVSKEAIAMSVGFLERVGCAALEPEPLAHRGKVVRLTTKGQNAQAKYLRLLADTEAQWQTRFGEDLARLRDLAEGLVGVPGRSSRLWQGLEPYPDGWRASARKPEILPHYPMVLHRGGWPDGS